MPQYIEKTKQTFRIRLIWIKSTERFDASRENDRPPSTCMPGGSQTMHIGRLCTYANGSIPHVLCFLAARLCGRQRSVKRNLDIHSQSTIHVCLSLTSFLFTSPTEHRVPTYSERNIVRLVPRTAWMRAMPLALLQERQRHQRRFIISLTPPTTRFLKDWTMAITSLPRSYRNRLPWLLMLPATPHHRAPSPKRLTSLSCYPPQKSRSSTPLLPSLQRASDSLRNGNSRLSPWL